MRVLVFLVVAVGFWGCPSANKRSIVGGSLPCLVHPDEEFVKLMEYIFFTPQVEEAIVARMCRRIECMSPEEAEKTAKRYLGKLVMNNQVPPKLEKLFPKPFKVYDGSAARKLGPTLKAIGRRIHAVCRAEKSKFVF